MLMGEFKIEGSERSDKVISNWKKHGIYSKELKWL